MSRAIVVTGGRTFTDAEFVNTTLDNLHRRGGIIRLAHGGAKGADSLCAAWARRHGINVALYKADWASLGTKAGPYRNAEMLLSERPDMVVAFPGGRGTAHCVAEAKRLGFIVADLRKSYIAPPIPARGRP